MLNKLLKEMTRQGLDMLIVVSTDEHLNEYVPPQNRRLEASTESEGKSGFSGSAGTAIFCVEGRSQLFVDSRYHLQAEQICGEHFNIQKMGNEGVQDPQNWIAGQSGNLLKAEPICEKLISENPKTPFLYNLSGLIFAGQRKFDSAIKRYEAGLRIDPKFGMIYNNLGLLFLERKSYGYKNKAEEYVMDSSNQYS